MDYLQQVALAAGLAWASGLRLYALLFVLGLIHRMDWFTLPPSLAVLSDPLVLGASGFMLWVEFFADKIPGFDSLWDAVHTFIRIPGGALLAAGAMADQNSAIAIAAAILGGTIAGGTHFTKAGSRALINTSPEPISNWTASFAEDAAVAGGLWFMFQYPLVFLALLLVFLLLCAWLIPKLWRAIKGVVARIRDLLRGDVRIRTTGYPRP
ncbi:MAG: DUF4126 domain-containing protein [Burkholderiales bacterium]|nr:DUF4126 domain-containing protein [Burkholderiales bacterium]